MNPRKRRRLRKARVVRNWIAKGEVPTVDDLRNLPADVIVYGTRIRVAETGGLYSFFKEGRRT